MSEQSPTRFLPVEVFRRQHELGRTPIYDALRRGEVPHVRIGRKILIPENALDLMLAGVTVTGAQLEGSDKAVTMKLPEHDDGPRPDVPASSGAVVRTVGTVRPGQGRSQPTPSSNTNDTVRHFAWARLWDRLLADPERDAA